LVGDGCNLSSRTRPIHTPTLEDRFDLVQPEPDWPALAAAKAETADPAGLEPIEHRPGREAEVVAELASV
jgi:hypothetical protein